MVGEGGRWGREWYGVHIAEFAAPQSKAVVLAPPSSSQALERADRKLMMRRRLFMVVVVDAEYGGLSHAKGKNVFSYVFSGLNKSNLFYFLLFSGLSRWLSVGISHSLFVLCYISH